MLSLLEGAGSILCQGTKIPQAQPKNRQTSSRDLLYNVVPIVHTNVHLKKFKRLDLMLSVITIKKAIIQEGYEQQRKKERKTD